MAVRIQPYSGLNGGYRPGGQSVKLLDFILPTLRQAFARSVFMVSRSAV